MTSWCNRNMVHALTTYPTHPKFGTAITNKLNQKTTPQVRRPFVIVIHVHVHEVQAVGCTATFQTDLENFYYFLKG